jgi:hypothetical protein
MSDEVPGETPRSRVDRSASHYQPSPALSFVLLVLFVVSVFAVLHYVNPVSVGGQAINPNATSTTKPHHTEPTTTLPKTRVRVVVANGTTVSGLAAQYTNHLQSLGWNVLEPVDGTRRADRTVVYYYPGYKSAAKEVAKDLPVPQDSTQPIGDQKPAGPVVGGLGVIVLLGQNSAK